MTHSDLFGPGGAFAITQINKQDSSCRAFADSWPSLRHLYNQAAQYGDREFIKAGEQIYSYANAVQEAMKLAHILQNKFNVTHGDRVAIAMPNNPEWMISYIAITGMGAIVAPLNSWDSGEGLTHTLKDIAPKLIILDERQLDKCLTEGAMPCPALLVSDLKKTDYPIYKDVLDKQIAVDDWPTDCPTSDALALILYTSGTTSRAKGAMFTHHAVGQSLKNIALSGYFVGGEIQKRMIAAGVKLEAPQDFQPSALLAFPLFHVAASHAVFLQNMQIGGRIVILPKWDAEHALALIEKEQISSFSGVPAMLYDIIHHPTRKKYSQASLVSVGIGGAAETPEGIKRVIENFPRAVAGTGYGLSEAGGTVAVIVGEDYANRPKSVGRPLPSIELKIISPDGNDVAIGDEGEIVIKGATVFEGYWNNPEETSAMMQGGWIHTGDLGRLDEEGFLYITGRAKDMVISGGENIACSEIEFLLQEHPDISEVAAIGLPDDRMGEILAVVIHPVSGKTISDQGIKNYVGEHLAHYKVPQKVILHDMPLPRTALGKIIKDTLKEHIK